MPAENRRISVNPLSDPTVDIANALSKPCVWKVPVGTKSSFSLNRSLLRSEETQFWAFVLGSILAWYVVTAAVVRIIHYYLQIVSLGAAESFALALCMLRFLSSEPIRQVLALTELYILP